MTRSHKLALARGAELRALANLDLAAHRYRQAIKIGPDQLLSRARYQAAERVYYRARDHVSSLES